MSKLDLRTPIIYFLTVVIVLLLIIIKRMGGPAEKPGAAAKETIEESSAVTAPIRVKGKIGLIIDDFGYRNDEISVGFLHLGVNLTCAVIPGHAYSSSFGEKAVSRGHEVIVHMPMENVGENRGEEKFVLRVDMKPDAVKNRVYDALDQIPEAIGMNNHQGSQATADPGVMNSVAAVLKERNKFFIDSRTTPETVAESIMNNWKVPSARRNVFLDNDHDEEKIKRQLLSLVEIAERDGSAIGIGHVKQNTLNVLRKQIPELKRKGFKFEFVSNMLY
ncbi:MAG: divergent polysaccharide deacetylase family protein [Candidatus Neomarinimicrobiota bacterium]|nr:divergent polysaccharide deacetylase family protein [Candidatus Neomarinimicrobiota bacterium]